MNWINSTSFTLPGRKERYDMVFSWIQTEKNVDIVHCEQYLYFFFSPRVQHVLLLKECSGVMAFAQDFTGMTNELVLLMRTLKKTTSCLISASNIDVFKNKWQQSAKTSNFTVTTNKSRQCHGTVFCFLPQQLFVVIHRSYNLPTQT